MRGTASWYLANSRRVLSAILADPAESWTRVKARLAERSERARGPCHYRLDSDWEERLHALLEAPWACKAGDEFWSLWSTVTDRMAAKGLRVGPASYGVWNDGDPEFVRAVWCAARHLRPMRVVETGVARGLTTRFILEALERNGAGHLWSIDLPPPLEPELHGEIASAVEGRFADRWSYIRGSSRRRLPGLLRELGRIDLFVHDSSHSGYNTRFELSQAWPALRLGGVLVVDDIDFSWAFHEFQQDLGDRRAMVCQARPLQPDLRRFDHRGLFGIAVKSPAGASG